MAYHEALTSLPTAHAVPIVSIGTTIGAHKNTQTQIGHMTDIIRGSNLLIIEGVVWTERVDVIYVYYITIYVDSFEIETTHAHFFAFQTSKPDCARCGISLNRRRCPRSYVYKCYRTLVILFLSFGISHGISHYVTEAMLCTLALVRFALQSR